MFRLSCIAGFCLAVFSSSFGQVAPGSPIASGRRPTPAAIPSENQNPNPTVAPAATAESGVRLQFPNSDVADVLRYYEELTGKKLIMDNNVVGKVNIFISKPVTHDEAIRIIEMNLLLNGYSLVPAEGDIVKVIGTGKNPRTAGVPIISDEADIPEGDHVISYLFKLRYADPQELQQVLGQYLSPPQPYTSFLALPKSSSILVTENSSVIRGLVRIIDQVDIPPAEVESEFIKLERADASKVVDMLKDIFEKGTQGGTTTTPGFPGGVRAVRPVAQVPQTNMVAENDVGALIGLSEDSVVVGKIKIAADVRTNRIHVITRPVNLPFVRKLIAEFDANVDFAKPVTRPLRFISAGDVLPVLVQALTEPGQDQQGGGANGGAGNQNQPNQPRNNNSTNSSNPYASSSSNSDSSGSSSLNVSEELSTQPVDTAPKAVTIGNAKIIADQRANAIIVLGNREVVLKVTKILDQMDVRAPQVALTTVIGELTLSNTEEFGIDYFLQFKNKNLSPGNTQVGVGGGLNTGQNTPIIDPASLITFPVLSTLPTGATAYVAAGNTLAAIVKALDSTGRFRTISRPMVYTSNNKKAIIASGTEIPVPVNTIQSATGGGIINTGLAQQSNIQFKKVALQLEVVPLINSDKEVSLDILQKLDSVADSVTVDGNQIPTIATRYIKTTVSAPNGSTIVLGGLITDDRRRSQSGFPILNRLPVVGALFRDTNKSKIRRELIVLMRPEVTMTALDQYHLRKKTEDNTHFGPELDQEDCIDCPKVGDQKQTTSSIEDKQLPPPDLPPSD